MVKYYYAGGQRVAMRKGTANPTYLLGDHLGSTSITANSNGTLATEQRYYPWGATRYGSSPTAFQYTGQRNDSSIGLYFYNARYYDPALGRFVQADSIVPQMNDPQLFNRYSYAGNNPILYNDPDGHCGPLCWTGIGLFLTGFILTVNASDPLPPELRPSEEQGFLGLALMGLGLGLQQIDLLAAAACGDLNCTNEMEQGINKASQSIQTGLDRVQRVANHFGDEVVEQGRQIKVPGVGSTDVDIVLTGNRFVEVGGYAKGMSADHISRFGTQLKTLVEYANLNNGQAYFYYDQNTPQAAIDLAIKWLGAENVLPIP